jgi:PST family polysaccharide transporter
MIQDRLRSIGVRLTAEAGVGRLLAGLGWYALAEVAVRLSRLVATVVLARVLFPADYGLAAAVLTCFELVRLAANNGVGLLIVRAAPENIEAACATAFRVSLCVAAGMIALQLGVGAWLAQRMDRTDVALMLTLLALNYVMLPLTEVRWCRMLRAQRLQTLAAISATQVVFDNGLTILLALNGAGPWAVVLPKLLTTPLYAWLIWRAEPWQRRPTPLLPWREVRAFALPVVGTEALGAARQHLDKVLVGTVLGLEALGSYAFAFNAGLGLGLALGAALNVSLFPHLAAAPDRRDMTDRFDAAVLAAAAPIAGLLAVQALAALTYVPLLFGPRWAFAAPLVAVLCLSALARPLADAACQLLRARGETHLELAASALVTAGILGAFAASLPLGLWTAVVVLAGTSITLHLGLAVLVRWHVGRAAHEPVGALR